MATRIGMILSAALLAVLLGVTPALAWTVTPLPGTWFIAYSEDHATQVPWGTTIGGFGSNGFPIVPPGETIYIWPSVMFGTPNAFIWFELDGGNSPYPGPVPLLVTDFLGNGFQNRVVSWTNDLDEDFLAAVCTVPLKLSEGTATAPGDFDGHVIDHFNIGTDAACESASPNGGFPPGEEVPEFPLASAVIAPLGLLAVLLVQTYRKSSAKHL